MGAQVYFEVKVAFRAIVNLNTIVFPFIIAMDLAEAVYLNRLFAVSV